MNNNKIDIGKILPAQQVSDPLIKYVMAVFLQIK